MAYNVSTKLEDHFAKSYDNLSRAFKRLGAKFTTPSGDGYLRCVSTGNGQLIFSADAVPINSAAAQFLARDKLSAYQLLEQKRILIPKGIAFFKDECEGRPLPVNPCLFFRNLSAALPHTFPLLNSRNFKAIVKPGRESRGRGLKLRRTLTQIIRHAKKVLEVGDYGLVQEYVEEPEYRVAILDELPLVVYRKPRRSFDSDGTISKPDSLPILLQQTDAEYQTLLNVAIEAHRALGLRYSGVDICLPRQVPQAVVLEVNGNPGFDFLEKCHPALAQEVANKVAQAILGMMPKVATSSPSLKHPIRKRR